MLYMGNCVFRGFGRDDQVEEMVKVVTSNGGIMELYAPITAGCITDEFPGHGIFFRLEEEDLNLSPPLLHTQHLRQGQVYYLLPLDNTATGSSSCTTTFSSCRSAGGLFSKQKKTSNKSWPPLKRREQKAEDDHHRYYYSDTNNSTSSSRSSIRANRTPYRMSFDNHHGMSSKRCSEAAAAGGSGGGDPAVLPRYNSSGVWKVRLVINPEQLSEILSQESRTEALIESVRTVAKCGGNINNNTGAPATATSWISSMAATNYYSNQSSVSTSWRTEPLNSFDESY